MTPATATVLGVWAFACCCALSDEVHGSFMAGSAVVALVVSGAILIFGG